MLTWTELLLFYGANVVVWLGIALLYVHYFYESDATLIGNADAETSTEEGVDHG
ncbi:hypothetical protein [Halopenitus persicus]|uniref:Uncharacterized protein n=1 Tax=Halopenitus persicus TaxID=1048396 RepID=A0A1H3GDP6_9EURY|nr:hypothetical protein [Halopenitus persicus]SDY00788.1 hypothetical protein SAMN05216564_102411 [Halopenitus persicus]